MDPQQQNIVRGIVASVVSGIGVVAFGCASGHTKPAYGIVGLTHGLLLVFIISAACGAENVHIWASVGGAVVAALLFGFLFVRLSGRLALLSIGFQSGFLLPYFIYACIKNQLIADPWPARLGAPISLGLLFTVLLFWRDERWRIPAGGLYAAIVFILGINIACESGISKTLEGLAVNYTKTNPQYTPEWTDYIGTAILLPVAVGSIFFQRWFRHIVIKPPPITGRVNGDFPDAGYRGEHGSTGL